MVVMTVVVVEWWRWSWWWWCGGSNVQTWRPILSASDSAAPLPSAPPLGFDFLRFRSASSMVRTFTQRDRGGGGAKGGRKKRTNSMRRARAARALILKSAWEAVPVRVFLCVRLRVCVHHRGKRVGDEAGVLFGHLGQHHPLPGRPAVPGRETGAGRERVCKIHEGGGHEEEEDGYENEEGTEEEKEPYLIRGKSRQREM